MNGFEVIALVVGVLMIKAFLVDAIKEYNNRRAIRRRVKNIVNMKL